jgi:hypothetical protein
VKVLSFDIDPSARWRARDSEPSVTLNLLPLFWTARPNGSASPRLTIGQETTCPRHIHSPVIRNLLHARLACATHAVRRTNQTSYVSYSISTTQNGDGMWVAAFGRYDEQSRVAGRTKPAVLETKPERAEVIALAEAQITIDDARQVR